LTLLRVKYRYDDKIWATVFYLFTTVQFPACVGNHFLTIFGEMPQIKGLPAGGATGDQGSPFRVTFIYGRFNKRRLKMLIVHVFVHVKSN
jgi:hypothetical protein